MRIILSRKGFDSGYGGWPSPVLSDGRMLSLPIPSDDGTQRYQDLKVDSSRTYLDVMRELGPEAITLDDKTRKLSVDLRAHLDPDIVSSVVPRLPGWKPLFGQAGTAAGHLHKQGVGAGDLFLFFGRFAMTKRGHHSLEFVGSEMHCLWGYILVDRVIDCADRTRFEPWMFSHPHTQPAFTTRVNNTLYVAARHVPNTGKPGAGRFLWDERLRLTCAGSKRLTDWSLPQCFRYVGMTYHGGSSIYGWQGHAFRAASKGQEFVVEENQAVTDWALALIGDLETEH
jgi:hypothetical protein